MTEAQTILSKAIELQEEDFQRRIKDLIGRMIEERKELLMDCTGKGFDEGDGKLTAFLAFLDQAVISSVLETASLNHNHREEKAHGCTTEG